MKYKWLGRIVFSPGTSSKKERCVILYLSPDEITAV